MIVTVQVLLDVGVFVMEEEARTSWANGPAVAAAAEMRPGGTVLPLSMQ